MVLELLRVVYIKGYFKVYFKGMISLLTRGSDGYWVWVQTQDPDQKFFFLCLKSGDDINKGLVDSAQLYVA